MKKKRTSFEYTNSKSEIFDINDFDDLWIDEKREKSSKVYQIAGVKSGKIIVLDTFLEKSLAQKQLDRACSLLSMSQETKYTRFCMDCCLYVSPLKCPYCGERTLS